MKKVIIAFCFICITVSQSFAGNTIILPGNFQSSNPSSDGMDIYIVTDDKGQTRSVTVIQLDENLCVATDSNGNSMTIFQRGFSSRKQLD